MPTHLIPESKGKATPKEVFRSLREGWTFVRRSPRILGILLRISLFILTGSGVLALLPVVARDHLGTGAAGYGLLLSAFGVGSVIGALCIPFLRRRFRVDAAVAVCLLIFSVCVIVVGNGHSTRLVVAAMLIGGLAWIVVAVNHNVSVQMCSPDWVRGRTISFYLLTFQGSLAIGSWLTGWMAEMTGVGPAVIVCGVLCAGGLLLIPWFPLNRPDGGQDQPRV